MAEIKDAEKSLKGFVGGAGIISRKPDLYTEQVVHPTQFKIVKTLPS